jgi:hypothetical protein
VVKSMRIVLDVNGLNPGMGKILPTFLSFLLIAEIPFYFFFSEITLIFLFLFFFIKKMYIFT